MRTNEESSILAHEGEPNFKPDTGFELIAGGAAVLGYG